MISGQTTAQIVSKNSSIEGSSSSDFLLPMNAWFPPMLFLIVALFAMVMALLVYLRKKTRKKFDFDLTTLRVDLPLADVDGADRQGKGVSSESSREKIAVMEQLFSSLISLRPKNFWQNFLGYPYFALEIAVPFNRDGIAFYVVVPKNSREFVQKQIHSFFPIVSVEECPRYNIFVPRGEVAGSTLRLESKDYLPLKTYGNLESDPLNNLTNSIAQLDPKKEGAAIQIVVMPNGQREGKLGLEIAKEMKQGKSLKEAESEKDASLNGFLWRTFFAAGDQGNKDKTEIDNKSKILTQGEEKIIESIENKAKKNAFRVNIRLLASSKEKERPALVLGHMEESFSQLNNPSGNRFKVERASKIKRFIKHYVSHTFERRSSFTLSSEELTSLFHFGVNLKKAAPRIVATRSRKAPCPNNISNSGVVLGKNVYRDQEKTIHLAEEDRRRHLYLIGQTGTGKSSLIANMIRQDIEAGKGVCLIDPHGDLVEKVLTYIPQERKEDVILFDPGDIEKPLGLNLLEFQKPEQKTFVINEMIDIFDKLYDMRQVGGPMFEQYMRNAMLLVMSHPESGSTLLEISRVLSDPDFRHLKLKHCQDPVVVDFWTKEAEKAGGDASLANMAPYITSKLTSFISNEVMRPIIAQQKSAFNLREAMDSQKIILMNLSKGAIGELNAYLLGMVMVGKILIAAMGRVDMPEDERKDFYLYIDEFHSFTTDSIATILSEARKYRLNLIISHQFIKQLSEKIRDSVFGNVGSLVSFRVGPADAEEVSRQFEPVFNSYDLMNLNNFNAYVKLLIAGQAESPFSLETFKPDGGDGLMAKQVTEYSRNRYGGDRAEIEKEIRERLRGASSSQTSGGFALESDIPAK